MLKTIEIRQLRIGMFVHDLHCNWIDHPFLRNRFLLATDDDLKKIIDAGISTVEIDTDKGNDVDPPMTAESDAGSASASAIQVTPEATAVIVPRSFGEELERAREVKQRATQVVRDVMRDARLGKAISLDDVQPIVQDITESILRNPGALIGLLRLRDKDDYTFLHSVSVCTLMVAFCRSMGFDSAQTQQAGLGGLLHDTGKAMVPDEILNKPGRLTDSEFDVIKKHPQDGYGFLLKTPDIGEVPLDITLHHHERIDGSGYPHRLSGEQITPMAQMAAIVDVYDAITSDRVYHKGIAPAEALRKIFDWSKQQFDPKYVQAFMRCVGIYPVGTLVLLESGRLAVVTEPHETNMLTPKVNAFFSTKSNTYIKPHIVDLSKPLGLGGGDKIISAELPERWRVDPLRFLQLAP